MSKEINEFVEGKSVRSTAAENIVSGYTGEGSKARVSEELIADKNSAYWRIPTYTVTQQ